MSKKNASDKWIFVISIACLIMAIILMASVHLSFKNFKSDYETGFKAGLAKCPVCENKTCPEPIVRKVIQGNQSGEVAILVDISG